MKRLFAVALLLAISSQAHATTLLTWNAEQASVESVTRREADIKRLGDLVRQKLPGNQLPDVTVLQEITSYASAMRIARALGYTTGTVAASDSGDDKEIWPFALEIAVVTTKRVISVTSYQSHLRNNPTPYIASIGTGDVSYGQVMEVIIPTPVSLPGRETIPRAILRVEIEGDVIIYGVHLNSSGLGFCRLQDAMKGAQELRTKALGLGLNSDADAIKRAMDNVRKEIKKAENPGVDATKDEALRRARSREAAAGAVAALAAKDVRAGKSVFVAGDFNTPLNQPCVTGKKLDEDFEPMIGCRTKIEATACGNRDGYDDTFAVLTDGLIDGMRFRVLTEGLGRTYIDPRYADSPIDNVLVAGPAERQQYQSTKLIDPQDSKTAFGSDHYSVLVQPAQ